MTANEPDPAGISRKEAAIAFLRLAASGKAREAFQKHVAPGFRHPNPFFRDDAKSLMTAMEDNAARNPVMMRNA
jgi:hypothetical protein